MIRAGTAGSALARSGRSRTRPSRTSADRCEPSAQLLSHGSARGGSQSRTRCPHWGIYVPASPERGDMVLTRARHGSLLLGIQGRARGNTSAIGRVQGPHPRGRLSHVRFKFAGSRARTRATSTRHAWTSRRARWILALALLAPLGLALDGAPRTFVVGLAAGVLVGAAFAWRLHVLDRATGLAATARVRAEISAESDARANSVLMQFEWAVNDIASLRTKLEKAEREVREHAQHAFAAERDVRRLERNLRLRDRRSAVRAVTEATRSRLPLEPVPGLDRGIPLPIASCVTTSRCRARLSAPTDPDNLPTRVRVFERDGNVICVSDPAIYDGVTRSASLKMSLPPGDLRVQSPPAAALDEFHFESLVAHHRIGVRLSPAELRAARNTRAAVKRLA